jgi:GGDEF domain-containing protein
MQAFETGNELQRAIQIDTLTSLPSQRLCRNVIDEAVAEESVLCNVLNP